MLVRGEAVLQFDPGGDVTLKTGDFLLIAANTRHRVESVSADAVWLALHFFHMRPSMCATFQFRGKTYKPGSEVTGSGEHGIVRHAWAGFARSEILAWWQKRGAVLIDLPAERFAESLEVTGKLVWDELAEGLVIRELVDIQTAQPLLKVVTRASSPEELERFQHPRMPLLEVPRFAPLPSGVDEGEQDLFG